jgi:transglutaminase-like putative cysteine protease
MTDATSTPGRRIRIGYTVDLDYEVFSLTDFVFVIHAARTAHQRVLREVVTLTPDVPFTVDDEPTFNNRLLRTRVEAAGPFHVHYGAMVEVSHHMVEPTAVGATPITDLPASTLRYLVASRYCQADHMTSLAWREFGSIAPGYAQVQAVIDWVRARTRFQVGTSGVNTSSLETLKEGVGVCRDFAHLTIALLRALNYPSRFVTAVDYGADPSLGPPDFHAYVETFLGDRWYLFDPTGITTTTGLIRIGTGRDAADVSFATMFGQVRAGMPKVAFAAAEDIDAGVHRPEPTELAVSTAAD